MSKTLITHIDSLSKLLKICKEDGLPTQIKIDTHRIYQPHAFWGFTGYIGTPIHGTIVEVLFNIEAIWLHSITCTNRYKHFVPVKDFIELIEIYLNKNKTETPELPMP